MSDDTTKDAYTIGEFCERHGISRSFYFKTQNVGLGPLVMHLGNRVMISREAAEAWRRERERAGAPANQQPAATV